MASALRDRELTEPNRGVAQLVNSPHRQPVGCGGDGGGARGGGSGGDGARPRVVFHSGDGGGGGDGYSGVGHTITYVEQKQAPSHTSRYRVRLRAAQPLGVISE